MEQARHINLLSSLLVCSCSDAYFYWIWVSLLIPDRGSREQIMNSVSEWKLSTEYNEMWHICPQRKVRLFDAFLYDFRSYWWALILDIFMAYSSSLNFTSELPGPAKISSPNYLSTKRRNDQFLPCLITKVGRNRSCSAVKCCFKNSYTP